MKLISLVLVVMLAVCFMATPAGARDIQEVGETVYDTARNANGSCPVIISPYIAKTWKDNVLPLVGKADVRLKLAYECNAEDLTGDNLVKLSFGLEL